METNSVLNRVMSGSLVLQILVGIVLAVLLYGVSPATAQKSMLLGNLFVQALKAVAPILVLLLVASALANPLRADREIPSTSGRRRILSGRG